MEGLNGVNHKQVMTTDKTIKSLPTSEKKNQPRFTDSRPRSKILITVNRQSNEILIGKRHVDFFLSLFTCMLHLQGVSESPFSPFSP